MGNDVELVMATETSVRLWRGPDASNCSPDFDELFFIGERPPDKRGVLLDLAFVCDDADVWVNWAIVATRSDLVRDLVSMHWCCGCRGSKCMSNNEVRIVLPEVRSADLEKVFELLYLGSSVVDSLQTFANVKAILRMLAMDIVPHLDHVNIGGQRDVDEAFGNEDGGDLDEGDVDQVDDGQVDDVGVQGSSSSGKSNRKRRRAEPVIADKVLGSKRNRGSNDSKDGVDNDDVGIEDDFDDGNENADGDYNNDKTDKSKRSVEAKSVSQRRHGKEASDKTKPSTLRSRIKGTHAKAKKFKCQQCNFSSSFACNLRRHKKAVHDKVRGFKCEKCDYSASQAANLKAHIKQVHDKIRDFKCVKCDYSASQASTLKLHLKLVHDKIRDSKCKKCDYATGLIGNLRAHIKEVHDKIRNFKCKKCNYSASRANILRSHIKKIHDNDVIVSFKHKK